MSRTQSIVLLSIAGVVVLGGIITGIFFAVRAFISDDPAYALELTIYPENVAVSFDGEEPIEHTGTHTYDLETDEALLTITRDDFATFNEPITVEEGTNDLEITLEPLTEEANEELLEQTDYYQEQADFTRDALEHAEALHEDNPVLDLLPHQDDNYRAAEGISEDGEHDFAIYLYLYEGDEEQGREDFTDWLADEGYDITDYEIVEDVDTSGRPVAAPDLPTEEELAEAEAIDVESLETDPEGMSADEVATEFLHIVNTHDAGQDISNITATTRAGDLMTPQKAETIEEPENPFYSPIWWDAFDVEAVSSPWIYEISREGDEDTGVHSYRARVCWQWISPDGDTRFLDNPRTWTLTVGEEDDGTQRVRDFNYQDAYVGDNPETGICGHRS